MRLKFLRKDSGIFYDYRIESKPPMAGEPIITARVMTIPNAMPTIMKRLFIRKFSITQLKTDCIRIG